MATMTLRATQAGLARPRAPLPSSSPRRATRSARATFGYDPLLDRLAAQVVEQLFLRMHLAAELQLARGRHVRRVGVDRLGFGEVDDRRERFGGFEDLKFEI